MPQVIPSTFFSRSRNFPFCSLSFPFSYRIPNRGAVSTPFS
nr:MAG TPA: hypothetical protein [Caudoviricetes sp.]